MQNQTSPSITLSPEAKNRLMTLFGNEKGLALYEMLQKFCDIVSQSGEPLIVPPELDTALHEVLSVRPALEKIEPKTHVLKHVLMQHASNQNLFNPQTSVGKTLEELQKINGYESLSKQTLSLLKKFGFSLKKTETYTQPACTLSLTPAT